MIPCVLKRILYNKKSILQLLESPILPVTEIISVFIFAYGYFTLRLTVRGGGSPLGPDCKQTWKFWFFSLKLDSLTLKTHFISLWRVSKMHFSCPFTSTVSEISIHYESGLCYFGNIHPLWEQLVLFHWLFLVLCKIRFRTHRIII